MDDDEDAGAMEAEAVAAVVIVVMEATEKSVPPAGEKRADALVVGSTEEFVTVRNLYFRISVLTAVSSASKAWTCCCKAAIAPMQP
jgi:hypothetical protein